VVARLVPANLTMAGPLIIFLNSHFRGGESMLELHTDLMILTFDGTVLEKFMEQDPSARYHAAHIVSAAIETDRKDRRTLKIVVKSSTAYTRFPPVKLAPEEIPAAEQLVEALNRAKMEYSR
jgi:hypothetical protein